jgi:hypothetical protein
MSDINTASLNTAYPQAGKDNSTQGFRDNYLVIKTALDIAHDEITDLETTAARLNNDNDFGGLKLIDGELTKCTVSAILSESAQTDDFTVDWQQGQVQQWLVYEHVIITLTGWPESEDPRAAELRLYLTSNKDDSTRVNLEFATVGGTILYNDSSNWNNEVEEGTTHCYVFNTLDGGATVYARLEGVYSPR